MISTRVGALRTLTEEAAGTEEATGPPGSQARLWGRRAAGPIRVWTDWLRSWTCAGTPRGLGSLLGSPHPLTHTPGSQVGCGTARRNQGLLGPSREGLAGPGPNLIVPVPGVKAAGEGEGLRGAGGCRAGGEGEAASF